MNGVAFRSLGISRKVETVETCSLQDQHAYAKKHFKNPMVDIRLQDYRSMTGQFDRIYSAPWTGFHFMMFHAL